MKVVVDATPVGLRLKGTGRVLVGLLRAFPGAAPEWEFVALVTPEGAQVLDRAGVRNVKIAEVSFGSATAWELHGLPQAASRAGAEIVLTLREVVGFGGPPTLMHIAEPPAYRITERGRPWKHQAKDRLLHGLLRGSVRRAAVVTAASPSTASWLRARYGIEPGVIPPGIDPFFLEPGSDDPSGERYFLHAATGDLRDNTALVLRSFRESDLPSAGVRLVIAGTTEDQGAGLRASADSIGIGASVDVTGWVSDERLRALYGGAIALVQPSRFEGFAGLQPLEAMAQGTPVVVFDGPGVTEALGSAAEIVPSDRMDLLSASLRLLAEDHERRDHLGEAGRTLARGFTWERAARSFVEVVGSSSAPS